MTQRVLILGATSAIAVEVARLYATRDARLHLVGRNEAKLAALVDSLRFASPSSAVADFADLQRNEQLIADSIAALGGLDVALIAHGDLGDQLESERSSAAAEQVIHTNFVSVVSLLVPLANALEAQRSGCIGVITSVAGERGRPRNYTYGAAKGGLNVYLQGLRSRLYKSGVSVATLKLGPVDTPMTRDHHKNALFASAPDVARSIVSALDAGSAERYVPWFWGAIMPLVRSAPERLFQLLPFLSGR
jgi:short-subunit dehydrogenase